MTNHETSIMPARQAIDTRVEWNLDTDGLWPKARYESEDVLATVITSTTDRIYVVVSDRHSSRNYRAEARSLIQGMDIAEEFIRAARVHDATNDVALSSGYYDVHHHTFGVDVGECDYCGVGVGWCLEAWEDSRGGEVEGAVWRTPYRRRIRMAGDSPRGHVVERILCEDCSMEGV